LLTLAKKNNSQIPAKEKNNRIDFQTVAFTIDSDDTIEVDDAISIEVSLIIPITVPFIYE
jgi:exoribonuclease R